MGVMPDIAGRLYPRIYTTNRREDLHEFLLQAVKASGGQVLHQTRPDRAPIYLGVQGAHDERVGLLIYPFRANQKAIRNRPNDEHRLQVRYGAENTWTEDHPLGRDIAQVDTTLVLGVHLGRRILVGLDPALYDPLPMGISFEFKEENVAIACDEGWHVYERETKPGRRRERRVPEGLETVVLFRPEYLLDYARLEREASDLRLDPPLRYVAALAARRPSEERPAVGSLHQLERQFDMSSAEILDVINKRNRLAVAVRGGVAEFHLERFLRASPLLKGVESLDVDGMPDFRITLVDGRQMTIECKNVSPKPYENGDFKVEVQKTRASKNDPRSRLYRLDQFDLVAACLYAPTHRWEFTFKAATELARHPDNPDRIAPLQRVDATWLRQLADALRRVTPA
jgi:hypothetical protein